MAAGVLVTAAAAVGGISAQLAAAANSSAQASIENPAPAVPGRTISEVVARGGDTPGLPGSRAMVESQPRWQVITGRLSGVALVRSGAQFEDGVLVQWREDTATGSHRT